MSPGPLPLQGCSLWYTLKRCFPYSWCTFFPLLHNISDHHLINIQTKQYSRPGFGALAAPCPKTLSCLETFLNLSLNIQFLINKESLICGFGGVGFFFFSIQLALKLLSCFCCIFRKSLGLLEENYSLFLSLWSTCLFQSKVCLWSRKKRKDLNYSHIFMCSF